MEEVLSGRVTDAQIMTLLSGLKVKTETLDETRGLRYRHETPCRADFPAESSKGG